MTYTGCSCCEPRAATHACQSIGFGNVRPRCRSVESLSLSADSAGNSYFPGISWLLKAPVHQENHLLKNYEVGKLRLRFVMPTILTSWPAQSEKCRRGKELPPENMRTYNYPTLPITRVYHLSISKSTRKWKKTNFLLPPLPIPPTLSFPAWYVKTKVDDLKANSGAGPQVAVASARKQPIILPVCSIAWGSFRG